MRRRNLTLHIRWPVADEESSETINNIDNYQLFLKAIGPELISARELMYSHVSISWQAQL